MKLSRSEKWRILKNVTVLSCAFMVQFTAFQVKQYSSIFFFQLWIEYASNRFAEKINVFLIYSEQMNDNNRWNSRSSNVQIFVSSTQKDGAKYTMEYNCPHRLLNGQIFARNVCAVCFSWILRYSFNQHYRICAKLLPFAAYLFALRKKPIYSIIINYVSFLFSQSTGNS